MAVSLIDSTPRIKRMHRESLSHAAAAGIDVLSHLEDEDLIDPCF
jgi:hypothetical protein